MSQITKNVQVKNNREMSFVHLHKRLAKTKKIMNRVARVQENGQPGPCWTCGGPHTLPS